MINLKNKKVTVMGLGLYENGSGISATKFLVAQGAKVTVTDLKTEKQLAAQLKRLGTIKNKIKFVLGKHREEDFKNADLIVKNPGVPNTSKYLKVAKDNKIPIETDISLFFQLVERKRIVGITGTRGKSTTTTLIYELLKTADKNTVIGGNITKSPLAQLDKVKWGGPVVLELSSWMLESLQPLKISPHLAVFTNIYPDHLNTYSGMADYIEAKKNILKWQALQDYIIINRDNSYTLKIGAEVIGRRFWFSKKYFPEENGSFIRGQNIYFRSGGREQKIISLKDIKLLGQHSWENILAAVTVAMIFGLKPSAVKRVVVSFKGIPDRLEFLREIRGVKYYNDTTSTTPEATLAALKALKSKKKNIILIAGGADKGLDFKELVQEIKKDCQAVILLSGSGTNRLKSLLLANHHQLSITEVNSMFDAIIVVKSMAKKDDIVLLSPACASFGMFDNEFDRGDRFKNIVKKLK